MGQWKHHGGQRSDLPPNRLRKWFPCRQGGGLLRTRQACALQGRVLCGPWSTEHALRGTCSLGWADARKPQDELGL